MAVFFAGVAPTAAAALLLTAGHEGLTVVSSTETRTRLSALPLDLLAEVAEARKPLDEPVIRVYDRIAARHQPVCAPLRGSKCGGCHLKVSSEVESASRGRFDPTQPLPTCDQCGRIVWWESAT